jgi:DNA-directed RNA polymerase specialized sigma24 family protein
VKKDTPDFHAIEQGHRAIHDRLVNWAMWVQVRPHSIVQPMFRQYRSHAWQWHPKEHRPSCDTLDAQAMEKVVAGLPPDHAFAVRWYYVWRMSIGDARRAIGVSSSGLHRYLRDGRQMVVNLTARREL